MSVIAHDRVSNERRTKNALFSNDANRFVTRKKNKERIDDRKKEKRPTHIYKCAYICGSYMKEKEKSIVMTNNFKRKNPRLDKIIGIEQSPIESAVKLT